jgi:fucose permease
MASWKKVLDSGIQTKEKIKIAYMQLIRLRGVKQALAFFFFYTSFEILVALWGSTYMVLEKGFSPEFAARWISLFFVGITVGRIGAGFMTIKFSNLQLIRFGCIVAAVGIVFLCLPFGSFSILTGFLLMGLGCSPLFPSIIKETPGLFGKEHSQSIIGLEMTCTYIGSTFIPPIFGAITTFVGYTLYPILLAGFLAAVIVLIESLYRKHSPGKA